MQKINILGMEYSIVRHDPLEDAGLEDAGGYIDYTSKKIVMPSRVQANDQNMDDLTWLDRHCLRHEIVHAFLFESGLRQRSMDEELVDWIAWHIPAIERVMQEAGGAE